MLRAEESKYAGRLARRQSAAGPSPVRNKSPPVGPFTHAFTAGPPSRPLPCERNRHLTAGRREGGQEGKPLSQERKKPCRLTEGVKTSKLWFDPFHGWSNSHLRFGSFRAPPAVAARRSAIQMLSFGFQTLLTYPRLPACLR
jgi:hypothetical protein